MTGEGRRTCAGRRPDESPLSVTARIRAKPLTVDPMKLHGLSTCLLTLLLVRNTFGTQSSVHCPTNKRYKALGELSSVTNQPLPRVLLYSFEGSGNTWTRSLLENATGNVVNRVVISESVLIVP